MKPWPALHLCNCQTILKEIPLEGYGRANPKFTPIRAWCGHACRVCTGFPPDFVAQRIRQRGLGNALY